MASGPGGTSMRRLQRGSRGLAEIVGTLMLVVIVVAAATAFSFFVATYQKQVQAQEALEHDKALEKVRVLSLQPNLSEAFAPDLSSLLVEVASLDVNTIDIASILLTGNAVVAYNVTDAAGGVLATGCLAGNPYVAANGTCTLQLAPESQVFLQLDLNQLSRVSHQAKSAQDFSLLPSADTWFTVASVLDFEILTTLGNEFTQAFVPPVAVAGITFVTDYPILDGSNSYQPSEGATSNVTIDFWNWNVSLEGGDCVGLGATDCGNYTGQDVELRSSLTAGVPYVISLNVTNTESLVSFTQIDYEF
jgi:flagellin-like protein